MKKILFLTMFLISKVYAQTDTSKILDEVLIRASNRIPVTQKTIADTSLRLTYQGEEIPELLAYYPSMSSNSDGGHAQGYSYLSLRGEGQSKINMTLNGVPLNEPEDHGVYTSNYPSFINAIQSIQIQRGVGTSSNGTSSFIGSINFQSYSGLTKKVEAQIGMGSYNTERFNFSISSGLMKNNIATFVNIGRIETDGFRDNSGSAGGSIFFTLGKYDKKLITKISIFAGRSKNMMAWLGESEDSLKLNYRKNRLGEDNSDDFIQTHTQYQRIRTFNTNTKLTSTVFYNYLQGKYDVFSLASLPTMGYYANENQHSNWVGYINQLDYTKNKLKMNFGVSLNTYIRNHSGYDSVFNLFKTNYNNSGEKNEVSTFAKFTLTDSNIVYYMDLQARYTDFRYIGSGHIDKQRWLFFNPKFGIKVYATKDLSFYYSIGVSHREPTRNVMFSGGLYFPIDSVSNIQYKPEKVVDYEIGFNINKPNFKLQANTFLMYFKDEILPNGNAPFDNSLPSMEIIRQVLRYGIELDLNTNLAKNLNYDMNTTLSNNKGNNNANLVLCPAAMLKQSLTYSYKGLFLGLNNTFFSKSYLDADNKYTIPSYGIYGFNIGVIQNGITVILQGNNIANKKYYSNGYMVGSTKYLYANALSNFNLTIKFKI